MTWRMKIADWISCGMLSRQEDLINDLSASCSLHEDARREVESENRDLRKVVAREAL